MPAGKLMSLLFGAVAVGVLDLATPVAVYKQRCDHLCNARRPRHSVFGMSLTLPGFQGLAKDLDVLSIEYAQTGSMIVLASVFCHWLATLLWVCQANHPSLMNRTGVFHAVRPMLDGGASQVTTRAHNGAPIDANGNLTSDGTKTYSWNALNQLVEVKEGTTTLATVEYDGDGQRTEKAAGGITHTYIYDDEDIIEERMTGSSSNTIRYYHGDGIDEPLARRNSSNVVTYYLADHLGSIVQETNASGSVSLEREFDP